MPLKFQPRGLLIWLVTLVMALSTLTGQAQTVTEGPDSARVATPDVNDSLRRTEKLFGWRVTRPQKAALLALVLPGSGQIYNHQYWKLPLVYGGLGGVGYGLVFYQTRYREYVDGKNQFIKAQNAGAPIPLADLKGSNVSQETSITNVQRGIVFYRRNRDTFIAYTAVIYGITILDALVAAHLRDFDISEDISMRLDPAVMPSSSFKQPATGLALTFTLK
ncbi:hypothetical protein HMJ29_01625 [Hymenobacter taeanensis]|uniref:DUF5683 domain-containing protein n=1 Tax=Hymenobacter taeanensis TaxID=2735321 RepID=A0A6M6BD88_9BACT|nr:MULTISPECIES: DUF5683 domain-containing protein [Hymenobacter]QJX45704.1 hypothetical protein HMJ29_01625 [Hymenobacter taeanensis]UOQ79542.1 DUF5683 domain-containing protein [Hymenobacter sp. 5414T-23]